MMEVTLIDEIKRYGYLYQSLTLIAIGFVIAYDLYLYFFPIKSMEN